MKKYTKIGQRIKELREQLSKELKKELSQKFCAEKLEVSLRAYQNYEAGERLPPGPTLSKIAKFFNVTTDYILTGDEKSLRQKQLIKLERFAFEFEKHGFKMDPMMEDLFSTWRDLNDEGQRQVLKFAKEKFMLPQLYRKLKKK